MRSESIAVIQDLHTRPRGPTHQLTVTLFDRESIDIVHFDANIVAVYICALKSLCIIYGVCFCSILCFQ